MSNEHSLLAGAGQADITPIKGIQIAGDIGRYRPVEEIRDPLYAKALVLRSGKKTACFLSLDVAAIFRKQAFSLRRQVAESISADPAAVIPHCLQSHSVPFVGNSLLDDNCTMLPEDLWWVRGGDDRYIEPFFNGVMKAVEQARESLQPVNIKAGRRMDGRVAFNRRFVMRDGTARTHPPLCDPGILYCEGPTDPEVGVALFVGANDKPVAALLHHTCHPTHGYPYRWISADWPGAWAKGMSEALGKECVSLVVNGACGNIHHRNHIDPAQEDTTEAMGSKLTETATRVLKELTNIGDTPLDWRTRMLQIPIRDLPDTIISRAQDMLDKHPEPIWKDKARTQIEWDWVYALATLDVARQRKRQSWYDYEIQVLRVGDLAIVAWPGEPFVEAQLAVKEDSPAAYIFVAHLCNDTAGYQPTRRAFQRGGYETRTSTWSKLAPETLEIVQKNTTDMLRDLYQPYTNAAPERTG